MPLTAVQQPARPAWLGEVTLHQQIVASVRLECDVEDIAEERHRTHEHVDGEVCSHAHERDVRHSTSPGRKRNDQREQAGDSVAKAGDQSDDSVDAEPNSGARHAECLVEQYLDALENVVAQVPRAAVPPFWQASVNVAT